jgi:hypothetical protein
LEQYFVVKFVYSQMISIYLNEQKETRCRFETQLLARYCASAARREKDGEGPLLKPDNVEGKVCLIVI